MGRGKKALYNSLATALSQIVTMVCGFILPKLIISTFGSSYNGITASVSQFLSVIALLRSGIGGATRASLYKSLALNDTKQISATVRATEIFMRKVALVFLGIVIVFSLLYPLLVQDEFEWQFSASLVLILSLSTFIQYFFGITYQILFQADQRQYIASLLNIVTTILNTFIAVILINNGVGIHGVKLGSAFAYSISPIVLNFLAKRKYRINKREKPDFSSINQRWDAFYHQLAWFIHNNTDIALLTLFTNTKEISVYTVYYLVANGLKSVMNTLVVGVESAFGNIIAKKEEDVLKTNVIHYETMLHVFSSIIFGAAIVLITPFVQVYTKGVTDVCYTRYIFGYLAIIGEMLYVLRSPYEALVNASGHFKQTKQFAFTEAGINLLISIVLVRKYGMVGVVVGTVIAIIYKNVSYGTYISKNILNRSMSAFYKRFIVTGITIITIWVVARKITRPEMTSYANWVLYAIRITLLSIACTLIYNFMLYKKDFIRMVEKMCNIIGQVQDKG